MKAKLSILILIVFSTSCTSYITVINETKSSMETVSALTKEDQSNFNLSYTDIINKNILKAPLKPNESLKIKNSSYVSIVALTEDFDSFIEKDIKKNEITIRNLNYNSEETVMPMDGDEPDEISIKISNQSKLNIEQVDLEFAFPFSKKTKKESVMNFWNVILPDTEAELKHHYYPPSSYKISAIIIKSSLDNESFEKRYTENLQSLIVFDGN